MKSNIFRRAAAICTAFAITVSMMPVISAQTAYATTVHQDFRPGDGFIYDVYDDGGSGSIFVTGYEGSSSEILLPSTLKCDGVTFNAWVSGSFGNGGFIVATNAFRGNTKITKIAIPDGYEMISATSFQNCTGLTEVSIGQIDYSPWCGINSSAFLGCVNLKTYNIDSRSADKAYAEDSSRLSELIDIFINAGIGTDSDRNPIAGVAVWTQKDSIVWQAITELNKDRPDGKKITLNACDDPYARNTVSGSGGAQEQKGEDGTPYGRGASESVVHKALTGYSKETDPKGTVFGLLKAKLSKATKTSVTLQWSKASGAKKYIVYGNACGTKNKMKKLTATGKTKLVFKKVNGKKLKKGTYYKFVVVALDKNNRVISTSKIVHAATSGGKVGNDKAVKTKAKKDKVTLKKGKTFKLGAKPVAKSKKLKVKRHRGIAYETSNGKIATVNKKGVIKAVGKGKCTVYAYAQNGVCKAIKVTVK